MPVDDGHNFTLMQAYAHTADQAAIPVWGLPGAPGLDWPLHPRRGGARSPPVFLLVVLVVQRILTPQALVEWKTS